MALDVFLAPSPHGNRDARNSVGLHASFDLGIELVERYAKVCAVNGFNHGSGDFVRQSI
jgi:hypothetical protein